MPDRLPWTDLAPLAGTAAEPPIHAQALRPARGLRKAHEDLDDIARTLCALATLSFALGEYERCANSVDAADAPLRERGTRLVRVSG